MLSPDKGGATLVCGHTLGHATYERHRLEQTLLYQLDRDDAGIDIVKDLKGD